VVDMSNKWVNLVDSILFQVYYRTLGMVSLHGPVEEIYEACEILQKGKRGGNLYWVITDRIANWEDVKVADEITMTVRIFGSAIRGKNTVFMRKGFFTSYLIDLPDISIKNMALVLGTRRLM
jgi:hypothetical protein